MMYIDVPEPDDGEVIARYPFSNDNITIRENKIMRWMHFSDDAVQATMVHEHNHLLTFKCNQTCMLWKLFHPSATSFLIFGLGGGSMARFIDHHQANSHVTIVEKFPIIHKICKKYFPLPTSSSVVIDNAKTYPKTNQRQHDVIIVDIATHLGNPDWVRGQNFLKACLKRVNDDGLLIINLLPSNNTEVVELYKNLIELCGYPPLVMPVPDYCNISFFIFKVVPESMTLETFRSDIYKMKEYDLELTDIIEPCYKTNINQSEYFTE